MRMAAHSEVEACLERSGGAGVAGRGGGSGDADGGGARRSGGGELPGSNWWSRRKKQWVVHLVGAGAAVVGAGAAVSERVRGVIGGGGAGAGIWRGREGGSGKRWTERTYIARGGKVSNGAPFRGAP